MTDCPDIKTPLPGPKAKAHHRARRAPSCRRPTRAAIRSSSRAATAPSVEDVDGNVFLDCAAGIAVNSTGHSHPDVVKAITEQAQKFLHMSGTDFYYEPQVRLAEELAAIVPIAGRRAVVLRQLRHRGDRSVPQAGALRDRAAEHHRVPRRVPRPDDGLAVADGEQGGPAARLRAADAGRVSRAVSGLLPLPARARRPRAAPAECLDFIEHQLFVQLVSPDEVAAIVVEPIQGEGGYVVAPDAVPAAAARADEEARHPARRRRGAVGHGPDRQDVRDRALGVEPDVVAIAKGIASGLPLGVAVRARRPDDVAARRAREHVRRQPGVVRRGARDDHAAEGAADGERRGRRRAPDGRAAGARRTSTRSSATCAAAG